MSHKLLTFLFTLLFSVSLSAQTGFERIFPVDMSIEHLTVDGTDFEDGYLKLALTTLRDSATYKSANITKIDLKGAIVWSKNLVVEDSLELLREGDLMVLENGNIAVSLVGMKDSLNHFVAVTDASGNMIWSKKYAVYQDTSNLDVVRPRLSQSIVDPNSIYHATIGLYEDREQVYVSKISAVSGIVQWSNYIGRPDVGVEFGAITACREGGAMITGIDQSTRQFFVSKIDGNGDLIYNRSLTTDLMPTPTETFANDIIQLQDSSYVVIGNYRTQNVEDDGFILSLDTLGLVSWAKRVDFDFSFNDVDLLHVIESSDNALIVAAKQVGFLDTAAFALKLDYDGNVIWQNKYREPELENIHLGGLGHSTLDGGMSFFLTGGNEEEQYIAYLIATDSEGETLCNDTIDTNIVFDADFDSDTLELTLMDYEPFYLGECCDGYVRLSSATSQFTRNVKTFNGFNYLIADHIGSSSSFSKYDDQNVLIWSYMITEAASISDFEITDNNEFILVGNTSFTANTENKSLILKIDDNGNLLDSRTYEHEGREFLRKIQKHSNPQDLAFSFYISGVKNTGNPFPSDIYDSFVINLDDNLNIKWVSKFDGISLNEQLGGLLCLNDGNVMIYGSNDTSQKGRITTINGLDGMMMTSFESDQDHNITDMNQLTNGNFIVTSAVQTGFNSFSAEVSIVDNSFNVKSTDYFDSEDLTFFQNITYISDQSFYVTSKGADDNDLLLRYQIINDTMLNLAEVKYLESDLSLLGPILDFNDGNFVFAQSVNFDGSAQIILATGGIAQIRNCMEDTLLSPQPWDYTLDTFDIAIELDTLPNFVNEISIEPWVMNSEEVCDILDFTECAFTNILSNNFEMYSVPEIMLNVRPFCPNEPLIWTFYAETVGAVGYVWMNEDGDVLGTADSLTVMEEGMYNVAVTMAEDVCYVLCDTTTLEVFEEPEIMISDNLNCQSGEIILVAIPTAEAGIDSIFWSTGDSGPTISVADLGDYTVTLIDNCGIEVTASITLDEDSFPAPTVEIEQLSTFCVDGMYTLTASLGQGTGTGPLSSILWSTNETTPSITVSTGGIYMVTVLDACGIEAIATEEVILDVLVTDIQVSSDFSQFCNNNGLYNFGVVVNPPNANGLSISWDTPSGALGGTDITGTQGGVYTVNVTDICGNVLTESVIAPDVPQQNPDEYTISNFCLDGEMQLGLNEDIPSTFTYLWSTDEVTPTIAVPVDDGTYSVQVTDECGNTEEAEITISKDGCGYINFANVFIPGNSDAIERNIDFGAILFKASGAEETDLDIIDNIVTDYQLDVYNRWGEKVFSSDDFHEHWDGTFKEKDQPGDVYMYLATYSFNGREAKNKGDITLLR